MLLWPHFRVFFIIIFLQHWLFNSFSHFKNVIFLHTKHVKSFLLILYIIYQANLPICALSASYVYTLLYWHTFTLSILLYYCILWTQEGTLSHSSDTFTSSWLPSLAAAPWVILDKSMQASQLSNIVGHEYSHQVQTSGRSGPCSEDTLGATEEPIKL